MIARGLFATFFVLVGGASLVVGLVGLVAWAWGGFGPEVAALFVVSMTLAGLGLVGYARSLDGDRPWSLVLACVIAVASSCVVLAMLD